MIHFPDNVGFKCTDLIKGEDVLKICLIDADLLDHGSNFPNLALMKISGYCKDHKNNVRLICDYDEVQEDIDVVIMSKVFSFTNVPERIMKMINEGLIIYGGTGFFETDCPDLPCEVEHNKPDYDLYKEYVFRKTNGNRKQMNKFRYYLNSSIGFTTRGCFRKCSFCVNRKYDKVFKHSPVEEFYDSSNSNIILYDDNVMGSSDFKSIIHDLNATNKPFQFKQGLDIRLMTDEKAKILSSVKYFEDFIFAFDHIKDSDLIQKKLSIWRKHTDRKTKLYVLTGYEGTDEKDIADTFERIRIIMSFGCYAFVMKHQNHKQSEFRQMYVNIARWCNQINFQDQTSFREFCECNEKIFQDRSSEHRKEHCNCYQAMIEFEQRFPDIAEKYYDMKFEQLNKY